MHITRRTHYQAALQILRYLKGTIGLGLTFKKTSKLDLLIFINSNYGGSLVDRRYTTGYCTLLGGNLVTWRSKKQGVVSKSSNEAEFHALSSDIDEVLWIRSILKELKIPLEGLIKILCDNKSTIYIARDPMYHNGIKHVDIDRFYIKEKVEEKIIHTDYVPFAVQCADTLTALPDKNFTKLVSKLGMRSLHSYT